MPETDAETLQDLITERREYDMPTHVHVTGDFSEEPPAGTATASRVAALLTYDEGQVREEDFDDLGAGDVPLVTLPESGPPVRDSEARRQVRALAAYSRVRELGGIVVFAPSVSARIRRHLQACVRAASDGVDSVERLEVDHEGRVLRHELEGL